VVIFCIEGEVLSDAFLDNSCATSSLQQNAPNTQKLICALQLHCLVGLWTSQRTSRFREAVCHLLPDDIRSHLVFVHRCSVDFKNHNPIFVKPCFCHFRQLVQDYSYNPRALTFLTPQTIFKVEHDPLHSHGESTVRNLSRCNHSVRELPGTVIKL
jgi:hypothetical protein